MKFSAVWGVLAVLCFAACDGGGGGDAAARPDTLSREQRDSILGESGLPGARGVQRARDAAGRMQERAAQHDTLSQR